MEPLRYCTLTGLDERTDLNEVFRLTLEHPFVEWGVLSSASRQNEEKGTGRYPRKGWIDEFLSACEAFESDHDMRLPRAIHLCGSDVFKAIEQDPKTIETISRFHRVQLNFRSQADRVNDAYEFDALLRKMQELKSLTNAQIILQRNPNNEPLYRETRKSQHACHYLFDASGGNGISASSWPNVWTEDERFHRFGFAGGLGPEDLKQQMVSISRSAKNQPYWVDMESKLRESNTLQMNRCAASLNAAHEFLDHQFLTRASEAAEPPKTVDQLRGFWLDWFSGLAAGKAMVLPKKESLNRAVELDRHEGLYTNFSPTENEHDAQRVIESIDLSELALEVKKTEQGWMALTDQGDTQATSRRDSYLKGAVLATFGPTLPSIQNNEHLKRAWHMQDRTQDSITSKPRP